MPKMENETEKQDQMLKSPDLSHLPSVPGT